MKHHADFKPMFKGMSDFNIGASEMKNIRGRVEGLYSVYEFFILPNLEDGDKKFHVDCISTPLNQEEGFVIPQDGFKEVA